MIFYCTFGRIFTIITGFLCKKTFLSSFNSPNTYEKTKTIEDFDFWIFRPPHVTAGFCAWGIGN
jgi:hypothetical protein